jgi:hypothetical protein
MNYVTQFWKIFYNLPSLGNTFLLYPFGLGVTLRQTPPSPTSVTQFNNILLACVIAKDFSSISVGRMIYKLRVSADQARPDMQSSCLMLILKFCLEKQEQD